MASSVSKHRVAFVVGGAVVMVGLVVAVAVPLSLKDDDVGKSASRFHGLDCYPEAEGNTASVNQTACIKRGCTFNAAAPSGGPVCQYTDSQYRLTVTDVTRTSLGFQATLQQEGSSPFGGDIRQWTFTFENRGNDIAHFVFDATNSQRYKVPKPVSLPSEVGQQPLYEIRLTNNHSFAFQIVRRQTGTVIWDTNIGAGSLILSDQFLQISSKLPSVNVYGLGEHVHDSFRHEMNKTWPSFSRDQPPSWDAEANLYGVHPFYTCLEDAQGHTHGLLLLNSNAQEYAFSSLPSLTFRTIGGVLDFYIFLGPHPEQVIQQYTGAVGRAMMPPYWSLGFQLCRYGYNNISNLQEAVESTAKYNIPHDVQYADIDHMDTQKILTVSQDRFPGLNEYFKDLQRRGMRIIYILDPCMVANETNYQPYEEMKKIGGNIKWEAGVDVPANSSDTDGAILGYVWPQGKTVFPDYLKNSVKQVWKQLIVDYRHNLTFDGLWIDMNEPANFGTNEEKPFNWPDKDKPYWSLKCPRNSWEDPPYRPKAVYRWDNSARSARLSDKTICMSTRQGNNNEYRHYDVHSLYGWSQTDTTLEAAQLATGERSIVISRSTFPGSGTYAGHWLGDNISQWKDLRSSIIGILEFNLFGIPYVGADICGFFENSTTELCKRWMQLGAFYTYSRNHNGITYLNQGPGQLGDDVGYASRDILRIRYQLLPYLYTLFHKAHTVGSTVIRPLHHEFPTDSNTLTINRQFLWGACLLISPIVEQNQTQLEYYLPQGRWYNYYTHEELTQAQGAFRREPVDANSMPGLHVRGGCALIQQDYANNTHFSRRMALTLVAALDGDGKAEGSIFWDDGVSINTYENGQFFEASLSAADNSLTVTVVHWIDNADWQDLVFKSAQVLGVTQKVKSVHLQNSVVTFSQSKQNIHRSNGSGTGGRIADTWGRIADTGGRIADTGGPIADTGGSIADTGGSIADTGGPIADTGGLVADTGGSIADTWGRIADTGGRIADTGGRIADTGGPIADTGGSIADTGGSIADTGGPIADTGGLVADTGGSIADTGGSIADTGGSIAHTGGSIADTGGSIADTGGSIADTGGSIADTGGSIADTGGSIADTGGSIADTGGSIADTGGSVADTGGSIADTGGSIADTGGSIADTGGSVADTGGSIADTGGSIADTGGSIADTGGRIADTGGRIADTWGRIADTGGSIADTGGRIADTGGRIADTGGRIADTGGRIADTGGSIADTGGSIADTGGPIADTGGPIADTGGSIADTGGSIADTGGSIADTGGSIADTGGSIADTGGSIADTGGSIADTGGSIADNGGSIADTGGSIADTGGSIADTGGRIADTGGRIADTGGSIADTGGSIADTGGRIADTGGRIADTGGRIADTGGRIADTGGRIADTGGSIADTGDSIADTGDSIADTGDSIADTGDSITDTGGRIADTGGRIADTGGRIADTGSYR